MGIVLNPLIRLRRDRGRILIYRVDPVLRLVEKHGFIPPLSAILLSLFDGTRDRGRVVSDFEYLIGTDEGTALDLDVTTASAARGCDGEPDAIAVRGTAPPAEGPEWRQPRTAAASTAARVVELILGKVGQVFGLDLLQSSNGSGPRIDLDPFEYIMDPRGVDISPGDGRLAAPLELNYLVTHACPRRCVYCYAETYLAPRLRLLPLERFAEIAAEAGRLRVNAMYLSGGDPFARREIVEIISTLIRNGVPPFVSTKCRLTAETCESLRLAGLERMQVSLDSSEESLADEMTGSQGSFRETLETLDNLAAVGIRVRVKAVVTERNVRSIPALLEFLARRGITAIQISGYGRSVYRHEDVLFPGDADLSWLMEQSDRFQEAHPEVRLVRSNVQPWGVVTPARKRESWENRSACSAGRTAMTILPDGKVSICDQLPSLPPFHLGDLTHQSIMEIWNSEQVRRFLQPDREEMASTVCHRCPDFDECHRIKSRCLRDVYNVFREADQPDPKCPRAGVDVRF